MITTSDSISGRQPTSWPLTRGQNAFVEAEASRLGVTHADALRRIIDRHLGSCAGLDFESALGRVASSETLKVLGSQSAGALSRRLINNGALKRLYFGVVSSELHRPKRTRGLCAYQIEQLSTSSTTSSDMPSAVRFAVSAEMDRPIRVGTTLEDIYETFDLDTLTWLRTIANGSFDLLQLVLVTGALQPLTSEEYREHYGTIPASVYGPQGESPVSQKHHYRSSKKGHFKRYMTRCREYREDVRSWRHKERKREFIEAVSKVGLFPEALAVCLDRCVVTVRAMLVEYKNHIPVVYEPIPFPGFGGDLFLQWADNECPIDKGALIEARRLIPTHTWAGFYHGYGVQGWSLVGTGISPEHTWDQIPPKRRNIGRLCLIDLANLTTYGPRALTRKTIKFKSAVEICQRPKYHPKKHLAKWKATREWLRWFLGDYELGALNQAAQTLDVQADTLRRWLKHYELSDWLPRLTAHARTGGKNVDLGCIS